MNVCMYHALRSAQINQIKWYRASSCLGRGGHLPKNFWRDVQCLRCSFQGQGMARRRRRRRGRAPGATRQLLTALRLAIPNAVMKTVLRRVRGSVKERCNHRLQSDLVAVVARIMFRPFKLALFAATAAAASTAAAVGGMARDMAGKLLQTGNQLPHGLQLTSLLQQ
jgi:hypothetical protein